jgi:hypothetical protein
MGLFRKLFCPKSVYERRHEISAFWMHTFNGRVQYGPFKGLQMLEQQSWSSGDLAPKLFGLYEQEILDHLERLAHPGRVLIDIGAADGYYAVGALASGLFRRVIAFEGEAPSRASIAKTAALNSVSHHIDIQGLADLNWMTQIAPDDLAGAVVLIDTEGAEFDLLGSAQLHQLRDCCLIIELHDWMVEDGAAKKRRLLSDLDATHQTLVVKNAVRDLRGRLELETKNDDHRWLVCSEGRGRAMEWLVCEPKRDLEQGSSK